MKKIIGILVVCALIITACFNQAQARERTKKEPVFDVVTKMGTIRVKLYNDTPVHRNIFIKLIKNESVHRFGDKNTF